MAISATKLRSNPGKGSKLAGLVKRPGAIIGDIHSLPRAGTFDEGKWRKKWAKRLSHRPR